MRLSRSSRIVAALLALISTLFMQFAVASYACPGMKGEGNFIATMQTSGMDQRAMSGCGGMDKTQASLCHAHAQNQPAKQSLDKPELPPIQPSLPVGLVQVVNVIDNAILPVADPVDASLLARTAGPPITIRHCCFRI